MPKIQKTQNGCSDAWRLGGFHTQMFEKAGNHSDFSQMTSDCRICQSNQELFTKVMEILANFTFNFNFFQPDCSVSSPYWYTWLGLLVCRVGAQCRFMKAFSARELFDAFCIVLVAQKNIRFTVAPYAMMLPITFSYLVVRWLSFRESRGDPQYRVAWVGMSLAALVECFG